MDKPGVVQMPRIQINRIEASQVDTYGRCLYPGELMLIRGESRSKDLLLCGVNEFNNAGSKPTSNGAKAVVTGTPVVSSKTGNYTYRIDNIASLGNNIAGGQGFMFATLSDGTDVALITKLNTLACASRPILVGPTSDFMGQEKKDDIALVSDLTKIGPDYANAVNIGFTQLSAQPHKRIRRRHVDTQSSIRLMGLVETLE